QSLSRIKNLKRVRRRLSESKRNKNKTARNPANYHLYHALMEALIADEDAMDKEVTIKVKDHKRKHDSDDDEDDDDDKMKALQLDQNRVGQQREGDLILPLLGDGGGDAAAAGVMVLVCDGGNEDGGEMKVAIWTIPPNDFPEPEHDWANEYATTYKVLEENKLQRKTYDIGSFIKWFCRRTGKKKLCKADLEGPTFNLVKAFHKNSVFLQYQMDECHKLLTNKVDLSNPEGHQILRNIYEPLPLGGPPAHMTSVRSMASLTGGLQRRKFYINKHSESSDREAVRFAYANSQCDQC
ncbi:hypothetical protein Tco_0780382, partial [Tanacetum coccineum]